MLTKFTLGPYLAPTQVELSGSDYLFIFAGNLKNREDGPKQKHYRW